MASPPGAEAGAGPVNRVDLPERGKPARVSNFPATCRANPQAEAGSGAGRRRGKGSGYGDDSPDTAAPAGAEAAFGHVKSERADAALLALYGRLVARAAPKPGSFGTLEGDARRAYFRAAKQRSRDRDREKTRAGGPTATTGNMRAALADAALMLLATDGPGAAEIRRVLEHVFSGRPGVPLSIERKARAGKLKPMLTRMQP